MGVAYLWLIIFLMVDDVIGDSEMLFDQLRESQDRSSRLTLSELLIEIVCVYVYS
jgi:hypothetical protein